MLKEVTYVSGGLSTPPYGSKVHSIEDTVIRNTFEMALVIHDFMISSSLMVRSLLFKK